MSSPTVVNAANSEPGNESGKRRSGSSILLRLHWMLLGAAALSTCALLIVHGDHPALSSVSLAMWVIAASMVVARWVDISWLQGLTADGIPATRWHLRRYSLGVLGGTAALWAAALGIG